MTYDPETGAPLPVYTTLPYPLPNKSITFRRENFCGMRVPGLPRIPGGSADPSILFGPFIDRYGTEWQDQIIKQNLEYGYTHYTLSWPDSRAYGKSLGDYVQMAIKLHKAGLFVDHHFFSKVYDGLNPDPTSVYPVIDALLEAGALDIATIGWELNFFNSPEYIQTLIDGVVSRIPQGTPRYLHFSPGYASFQHNTGDSPHDFWLRQVGKITGLKYQTEPYPVWSAGMQAARINDVLVRLVKNGLWGLPVTFDVIAWEITAQTQFNQALSEDHGDLLGYESLCSPGPIPVMGYGNGGRQVDGWPL